jgi:hypothetical protein
MKCPHCSKDITEKEILAEAARIQGRKSRRKLTKEQAQSMAEKRWGKKEEKTDE